MIKIICSALEGLNLMRFLLIKFHAQLNNLSDSTDVAGMHRFLLASSYKYLNLWWFSLHQSKLSIIYIVYNAKKLLLINLKQIYIKYIKNNILYKKNKLIKFYIKKFGMFPELSRTFRTELLLIYNTRTEPEPNFFKFLNPNRTRTNF